MAYKNGVGTKLQVDIKQVFYFQLLIVSIFMCIQAVKKLGKSLNLNRKPQNCLRSLKAAT
mgnify:CR=1 FL=1